MRFAVDTSIVLDILLNDPVHAEASQRLLERHLGLGSVVICPVALSECSVAMSPTSDFTNIAAEMGLVWDDFTPDVCTLAATMWQQYRRQGGGRSRILPDFLIGAHAQVRSDGLLTRDRGFFRQYFQGLRVIEPG